MQMWPEDQTPVDALPIIKVISRNGQTLSICQRANEEGDMRLWTLRCAIDAVTMRTQWESAE